MRIPLFLCAFLVFAAVVSSAQAATDSVHFRKDKLQIETTAGKVLRYKVEYAATNAEQEQGLMFRNALAQNEGMLFAYKKPQKVYFWMKNTLIPLDMLFVRANGVISKIVKNAKPHDQTPIGSGEPVLAVIELKGGEADRAGIVKGAHVSHSLFKN